MPSPKRKNYSCKNYDPVGSLHSILPLIRDVPTHRTPHLQATQPCFNGFSILIKNVPIVFPKEVTDECGTLEEELSFDYRALRRCALSKAKAGHYEEAIALFNQVLKQHPFSANDYNNRGLVYFRNKQYGQAIEDYNRAIELNAELDSVYNNRANYHAHHGDFLGAILDYERAIELNPFNVRAWINQGITFRDLKMYDRALECFDSVLNFARLEEHIYVERGRTYHLRGDWNCAIADYQRAKVCFYASSEDLNQRSKKLLDQVEEWLDELFLPLESA